MLLRKVKPWQYLAKIEEKRDMCLKPTLGLYNQANQKGKLRNFCGSFRGRTGCNCELRLQSKVNQRFLHIIFTISQIKALKPASTEPHVFKIKWTFPFDFSSSEYSKIRRFWRTESSWSVLKLSFYIRHGFVQGPVCPPSRWETGNCPLFNGQVTHEPFKILQHRWISSSNF